MLRDFLVISFVVTSGVLGGCSLRSESYRGFWYARDCLAGIKFQRSSSELKLRYQYFIGTRVCSFGRGEVAIVGIYRNSDGSLSQVPSFSSSICLSSFHLPSPTSLDLTSTFVWLEVCPSWCRAVRLAERHAPGKPQQPFRRQTRETRNRR